MCGGMNIVGCMYVRRCVCVYAVHATEWIVSVLIVLPPLGMKSRIC